jgi:hypothetical protein
VAHGAGGSAARPGAIAHAKVAPTFAVSAIRSAVETG